MRLPKELNKQLFFCSMTCAMEFAVLQARVQGLSFCSRCKEWAGREGSLCTCKADEAVLVELDEKFSAEKVGVA